MHNTANHLAMLIERLAKHTNRAPTTISRLVTGSGDTINRLRRLNPDGKPQHRISTERVERAVTALSEMWPDDLEWPCTIPRPTPAKKDAA